MAYEFVVTSQNGQKYVGHTNQIDGRKYVPADLIYPQRRSSGPTNYAYTKSRVMDKVVLSRIVPFGTDSAGRPGNFLAHHLVLDRLELSLCKAGPAFVLKRRSFVDDWTYGERQFPQSEIPAIDYLPIRPEETSSLIPVEYDVERHIEEMINNVSKSEKKCILFYDGQKWSGEQILNIFYVAISRIDPSQRWELPFAVSASSDHRSIAWRWIGVDRNDREAEVYYRNYAERSRFQIVDLP